MKLAGLFVLALVVCSALASSQDPTDINSEKHPERIRCYKEKCEIACMKDEAGAGQKCMAECSGIEKMPCMPKDYRKK